MIEQHYQLILSQDLGLESRIIKNLSQYALLYYTVQVIIAQKHHTTIKMHSSKPIYIMLIYSPKSMTPQVFRSGYHVVCYHFTIQVSHA